MRFLHHKNKFHGHAFTMTLIASIHDLHSSIKAFKSAGHGGVAAQQGETGDYLTKSLISFFNNSGPRAYILRQPNIWG